MRATQLTVEELAGEIPDGAKLALPPDYGYCAFSTVRALIRRGIKNLHIVGVPTLGFPADLLVGAGCVTTLEAAAVTLSEFGLAPRFTNAVKAGEINIKDATCPAIHAALQASEKGIPFIPLRGLIGSDILARREDWKVGENPFSQNDPIVYLPPIRPDVSLFHAPMADKFGNIWIGVRREQMLMAHASVRTYVSVEKIVDGDFMADETIKAGTIPAIYVTGIAESNQGAWPLGIPGGYDEDREHLSRYVQLAQDKEGFQTYLQQYIYQSKEAAE